MEIIQLTACVYPLIKERSVWKLKARNRSLHNAASAENVCVKAQILRKCCFRYLHVWCVVSCILTFQTSDIVTGEVFFWCVLLFASGSMSYSSFCEPSTGLYLMSQSLWNWRSRGNATWPSRLWLKTRRPCWWVEAEGQSVPLQTPPVQVSRTRDTHKFDS